MLCEKQICCRRLIDAVLNAFGRLMFLITIFCLKTFQKEAVESLIKDLHRLSMMKPVEKGTDVPERSIDNIEKNENSHKVVVSSKVQNMFITLYPLS